MLYLLSRLQLYLATVEQRQRTETLHQEHCGNMTHVIWDILGNIFTLCCVLVSLPKHHFHARSEIQETIHSSLQAIRGLWTE